MEALCCSGAQQHCPQVTARGQAGEALHQAGSAKAQVHTAGGTAVLGDMEQHHAVHTAHCHGRQQPAGPGPTSRQLQQKPCPQLHCTVTSGATTAPCPCPCCPLSLTDLPQPAFGHHFMLWLLSTRCWLSSWL